MNITNRGGIFTVDLIVSFVLFFALLYFSFWQVAFAAENIAESRKRAAQENYAFFLADSLVKNSDENSLAGIAVFDGETRRVKSNEISEEKIKGIEKNSSVFETWVNENGDEKKFFSKNPGNRECIGVERLVLSSGKTALFGVKVCE